MIRQTYNGFRSKSSSSGRRNPKNPSQYKIKSRETDPNEALKKTKKKTINGRKNLPSP
jgi:hypothetical protein